MKTIFTILALLIFSLNGSAQMSTIDDFTVSWGSEYEFPKKHDDLGFWKGSKGGYINISYQDGKSMIVQRFDSRMKYTGEEKLTLAVFRQTSAMKVLATWGKSFIGSTACGIKPGKKN